MFAHLLSIDFPRVTSHEKDGVLTDPGSDEFSHSDDPTVLTTLTAGIQNIPFHSLIFVAAGCAEARITD